MIELRIKEIKLSKGIWNVTPVRLDFTHPEFDRAREQARLKSKHTMAASQSGETRGQGIKYNKQLMGIIAEMACKKYLEVIIERSDIENWEVVRYDDVRTDNFVSGADEYDIKIGLVSDPGEKYLVESRSSITHDRSLISGLENYDVIGPYTSVSKSGEDYNDFYIRPLYEYKDFKNKDYDSGNFENLLINRRIKLYLVAGCTEDDMKYKGKPKNMGQKGTIYQTLPILWAKDIVDFKEDVINLLKSNSKEK